MKNIGIIMIIITAAAAGTAAADRLSARCGIIRAAERLISKAALLIRCSAAPFEDIISAAAEDCRLNGLSFISDINSALDNGETNIRAVWRDKLSENPPPHIGAEELSVLEELGELLGSTDVQGQLDSLSAMSAVIGNIAEEAERESREKGKLYRSLGITAGLFAAVLFI